MGCKSSSEKSETGSKFSSRRSSADLLSKSRNQQQAATTKALVSMQQKAASSAGKTGPVLPVAVASNRRGSSNRAASAVQRAIQEQRVAEKMLRDQQQMQTKSSNAAAINNSSSNGNTVAAPPGRRSMKYFEELSRQQERGEFPPMKSSKPLRRNGSRKSSTTGSSIGEGEATEQLFEYEFHWELDMARSQDGAASSHGYETSSNASSQQRPHDMSSFQPYDPPFSELETSIAFQRSFGTQQDSSSSAGKLDTGPLTMPLNRDGTAVFEEVPIVAEGSSPGGGTSPSSSSVAPPSAPGSSHNLRTSCSSAVALGKRASRNGSPAKRRSGASYFSPLPQAGELTRPRSALKHSSSGNTATVESTSLPSPSLDEGRDGDPRGRRRSVGFLRRSCVATPQVQPSSSTSSTPHAISPVLSRRNSESGMTVTT